MLFFFKEKKLVVDCFTNQSSLFELSKPKLAKHFLPDWWKKLPKSVFKLTDYGIEIERTTMKSCLGFIDLYKSGFIIPNWSDLRIKTDEKNFYYVYSNGGLVSDTQLQGIFEHDSFQFGNSWNEYIHGKIMMPWYVKEKSGVKFNLIQPSWNIIDKLSKFHVVPGVLDFKIGHFPNVNAFFPRGPGLIEYDFGEPLVHLIPQSEKEIDLKIHLVDANEWNILTDARIKKCAFSRTYQTIKKTLESK